MNTYQTDLLDLRGMDCTAPMREMPKRVTWTDINKNAKRRKGIEK